MSVPAADRLNPHFHPGFGHPWHLHLSTLAEKMRELAPQCAGTVVDYGCGTKPYRTMFVAAERYIGTDLTVSDPGDLPLTADFRIAMPDGSADAVVSTQVLEHIPDVGTYLAECRRVLRPAGKLLLSTHGIWTYHTANAEDYRRWTHTGLAHELTRSGFRVLRIERACEGWACIAQQAINATAYEPAHFGGFRRRLFRWFCFAVNASTIAATRMFPVWSKGGPTLPIAYVVLAEKAG